jgi:hypothetical protein
MIKKYKIILLAAGITGVLTACGGGGGGGGSGAAPTVGFTSWGTVRPNTIVQANGGSTQFTYTSNTSGIVTSVLNNGNSATGANISLTYGSGNLNLTAVSIQSAQGASVSVNGSSGDTLAVIPIGPVGSVVYGINRARTQEVLGINAPSFGWEYQTYGVWLTGQNGAGTAGAVSAGSITPVTGMPATGSATFVGNALGVVSGVGLPGYATAAGMTANTNFGNRTIAFATSGTVASAFNGSGAFSAPGLNLNGTLSYSAGSNQFSGAATSASGLTGTVTGQFYGPTANEIGGTYNLSGSAGFMGGAFGGKR